MPQPCVTYARVSSEEQAKVGYSIPFQRARLEQHAAEQGFTIAARFEDVHSAKATGRPGFQDLLRFLEEHPEVRHVLVHRVDRLIRNHYEYGLIVEQLGVRVRSVVEPAEDNAAGRLMHGMNVVVAKYHSDNLSAEVKKGHRAKFLAGGYPHTAPLGYRNISRTRQEKAYILPDEKRASLVRLMFERYATGRYSYAALAQHLFDEGLRTRSGRPLGAERICRLLRHPLYCGLVVYHGETRAGVHEALVSRDLFDRVQRVMEHRSADHGEKGSKFFLLRGLLWCGACARRMTGEDHPRKRASYYRCLSDRGLGDPCTERYVPVAKLDAAVEALLPTIALREEARTEMLQGVRQLDDEQRAVRRREEQRLGARRERLQAKVTRLVDAFAAGKVPEAQYLALLPGYQGDLAVLDGKLRALARDLSEDVAALEYILDQATHVADLYALALTPQEKKDHLRAIFERIEIAGGRITKIEYHPPFHLLLGGTAAPRAGSGQSLERQLLNAMAEAR